MVVKLPSKFVISPGDDLEWAECFGELRYAVGSCVTQGRESEMILARLDEAFMWFQSARYPMDDPYDIS